MVSSAVIKRLEASMDALEAAARTRGGGVGLVIVPDTLDMDEVLARHYELFPEDRYADPLLIQPSWTDDPDEVGEHRSHAAWKAVARDERERLSESELRRLKATRRIMRNGEHWHNTGTQYNGDREACAWAGLACAEFGFPKVEALEMLKQIGVNLDDAFVMSGFKMGFEDRMRTQ